MTLIEKAMDKFVSSRFEGLDRETSFLVAKLESYRYLMDFTYYSGEPMTEENYQIMDFIINDKKFTQTAELAYRSAVHEKTKSPAV